MSDHRPTSAEVYKLIESLEKKLTHRFDRLEDKMNSSYMPRPEIEKEFERVDTDIADLETAFNATQRKIVAIASSISSILASTITLIVSKIINGG